MESRWTFVACCLALCACGGWRGAEGADAWAAERRTAGLGISTGDVHSCMVDRGHVLCWGSNGSGQLGDGTTIDRLTPSLVPGIADAVAVVAGGGQSCAQRAGGGILCWGDDGIAPLRLRPVSLPSIPDAVSISAQIFSTCAVRRSGRVVCWGVNDHRSAVGAPREVPGIDDAVQVSTGMHTCVTRLSGQVACWGESNAHGQLGDGTTRPHANPEAVPGLQDAVAVSVGGSHTCALRIGGGVACWGYNASGQLGDGSADESRASPTPVSDLLDAVEISAGGLHTCARRAGGEVLCWGDNARRQLGAGSPVLGANFPMPVRDLVDAVAVSAGGSYSCARRASGPPVCWGDNESGQLGRGTAGLSRTPVPVTGIDDAVRVAVGGEHTCALRESGRVSCWGRNERGQLGDGTNEDRSRPVGVQILDDATRLVAGATHTCALRRGGSVECWGGGSRNELGASESESSLPLAVSEVTGALEIGAGAAFTCVRTAEAVQCWGDDSEGQLGSGFRRSTALRRVRIEGGMPLTDVERLFVGDRGACARRSGGEAACWGQRFGVRPPEEPFTSVTLGNDHACLLRPAGTVVCRTVWTDDIEIAGVTDGIALDTAGDRTCALCRSGKVACWGEKASWTSTAKEAPRAATVPGLDDAEQISLGPEHACALRRGGRLACWGSNEHGQLGTGWAPIEPLPVAVLGAPRRERQPH